MIQETNKIYTFGRSETVDKIVFRPNSINSNTISMMNFPPFNSFLSPHARTLYAVYTIYADLALPRYHTHTTYLHTVLMIFILFFFLFFIVEHT